MGEANPESGAGRLDECLVDLVGTSFAEVEGDARRSFGGGVHDVGVEGLGNETGHPMPKHEMARVVEGGRLRQRMMPPVDVYQRTVSMRQQGWPGKRFFTRFWYSTALRLFGKERSKNPWLDAPSGGMTRQRKWLR